MAKIVQYYKDPRFSLFVLALDPMRFYNGSHNCPASKLCIQKWPGRDFAPGSPFVSAVLVEAVLGVLYCAGSGCPRRDVALEITLFVSIFLLGIIVFLLWLQLLLNSYC